MDRPKERLRYLCRAFVRLFADNLVNSYDELSQALEPRLETMAERLADSFEQQTWFRHISSFDATAGCIMVTEALRSTDLESLWAVATLGQEAVEESLRSEEFEKRYRQLHSHDAQLVADRLLAGISLHIVQEVGGQTPEHSALFGGISRLHQRIDALDNASPPREPGHSESPNAHGVDDTIRQSDKARDAMNPRMLPVVQRHHQLPRSQGKLPGSLILLGDGGIGKTVLAGQIYDELAQSGNKPLLVPCSLVPRDLSLSTPQELSKALANAASGDTSGKSLPDLQKMYNQGRSTVIIDTLDILLDEGSAIPVRQLLDDMVNQCEIVVTCRSREWEDFALGHSVPEATVWEVPELSCPEILDWVRQYQQYNRDSIPHDFIDNVANAIQSTSTETILRVPLRLAMVCDIYGPCGSLPEDLTVSKLYEAYWKERVAQDRYFMSDVSARAQVHVALSLARHLWESSERRLVEEVCLPPDLDNAAAKALVSEGVLRQQYDFVKFFHQTFAEFAMAQYLKRMGTDKDLCDLESRLNRNNSSAWGVARYLLNPELPLSRYRDLSSRIPLTAEGVRIQMRGALERNQPDETIEFLQGVADHTPELIRVNSAILTESGPETSIAIAGMLLDLVALRELSSKRCASAAAKILRTCSSAEREKLLLQALRRLSLEGTADGLGGGDLTQCLLEAFPEHLDETDTACLLNAYDFTVDAGRSVILSKFSAQDEADLSAVLKVATSHGLPKDSTDVAAKLMFLSAASSDSATWQSLLLADYAKRWDTAQIRAVNLLVSEDNSLLPDVMMEVNNPTSHLGRTRVNNVAEFIAGELPTQVSEWFLSNGFGDSPMAVATASSMIDYCRPHISQEDREGLACLLLQVSHHDPRSALPCYVRLMWASRDKQHASLESVSTALARDSVDQVSASRSRRAVAKGVLLDSTAHDIASNLDVLVSMVRGKHKDDRLISAELQGAATPVSRAARVSTTRTIVSGQSKPVGVAATRQVCTRLGEWVPEELRHDGVTWLVSLTQSRSEKSVQMIASAIASNMEHFAWRETHTAKIVTRLATSCRLMEDSQVWDELTQVLLTAKKQPSWHAPHVGRTALLHIMQAQEDAVYAKIQDRSDNYQGLSSYWATLNRTVSKVAIPHLGQEHSQQAVHRLLQHDTSCLSGHATRNTAKSVVGLLARYPNSWHNIEASWGDYPESGRAALAEAVGRSELPAKELVIARLSRHSSTSRNVGATLLSATNI